MLQFVRDLARKAGLTTTRCPVCSVLTNSDRNGLCLSCAESLWPRAGGHCLQCGEMFGDEDTPATICGECILNPPPWERLYFHGIYAGTLRDLILGYKFNGNIGSTRLLSQLAYTTYIRSPLRTPDVIVPVPLHTRRLLKRGFNQSGELCRTLSRNLDRPICNAGLVRNRNTIPQTRLGMRERQENIRAAFDCNTELVKDKTVLLVDDVYTTGATLRECAKTLQAAGVKGVDVLVLARAIS